MRLHHPNRTIEELVANIPDAKYFSKLDANSGYWQIELSDNSSHLTTFSTPFGRYKFKRMPSGISSGSDVFQQII